MNDDPTLERAGRPTLRVTRRFPHSIDKVWRAVTTPEHLSAWFPSPVVLELRPGGAMRFGGPGAGGDAGVGTVEAVEPPHLLTFTWGADRLTFELAADGDGTRLVLVHAFDDDAGAASFATGWEQCLAALRHVLADEPLPAFDRGVDRHEELAHRFALGRAEITREGGRWTMRFERQLTCPEQVAWDLWFGNDQQTGNLRGAPGVGEELRPYAAPDVVLGTVTEIEEPRLLAFDVGPAGGPGDHVRLELGAGTGHGARIVLTVTGTDPDELDAAEDQWGAGAIEHLAAAGAAWARRQPAPT